MKDIIHSCGDFPNVSLMGTWGCINYNLVLSTRKLKYPMESPLEDKLIEAFILNDMAAKDPIMLKKIRRAWEGLIEGEMI